MTATEIHARVSLIRQQLGPTFGRMQAEWLVGLVNRCFLLAYRGGVFPPAPKSIANAPFTIRYLSPLARSQALEDVTAIQQQLADVAEMVQFKPEIVDNYDWDEIQRTLADARGVPKKLIVEVRKLAAIRKARQDQAAEQMQAQEQAAMRTAAVTAATKQATSGVPK